MVDHYSEPPVETALEFYAFLKLAGDFSRTLDEITCRITGAQNRANRQRRYMEAAHKFTMYALFARGPIFVQVVMVLLIEASLWSWTVINDKTIQHRNARAAIDCS